VNKMHFATVGTANWPSYLGYNILCSTLVSHICKSWHTPTTSTRYTLFFCIMCHFG